MKWIPINEKRERERERENNFFFLSKNLEINNSHKQSEKRYL
mgnify:CR=1 FL=1